MDEWGKVREKLNNYFDGCQIKQRKSRMGKITGISVSTIDNYIRKDTIPNYNRGFIIAKYLENPPKDLVKKPKKQGYIKKTKKIKNVKQKMNNKIKKIEDNPILKTIPFETQRDNETYYQYIRRTGQIV